MDNRVELEHCELTDVKNEKLCYREKKARVILFFSRNLFCRPSVNKGFIYPSYIFVIWHKGTHPHHNSKYISVNDIYFDPQVKALILLN